MAEKAAEPRLKDQLQEIVGDEFSFCDLPGYRPQEFHYECPVTREPCSAKLRLISRYTRDIDTESIADGRAEEDVSKLETKLIEYSLWSSEERCTGDGCGARQAMDDSAARQIAVKGFRGFRQFFKQANER